MAFFFQSLKGKNSPHLSSAPLQLSYSLDTGFFISETSDFVFAKGIEIAQHSSVLSDE